MTGNKGEKRESLNILEKVGNYSGLLDKLNTEEKVRKLSFYQFGLSLIFLIQILTIFYRLVLSAITRISCDANHCNYNSSPEFLML
jgi:hypothetical protein